LKSGIAYLRSPFVTSASAAVVDRRWLPVDAENDKTGAPRRTHRRATRTCFFSRRYRIARRRALDGVRRCGAARLVLRSRQRAEEHYGAPQAAVVRVLLDDIDPSRSVDPSETVMRHA
jgi:hypothetical protein